MCKSSRYLIAVGLLLGVVAGAANAEIIAYWPFEEGEGDVAKDVVNDIEAKLTGVAWVPGHGGGFALNSPATGTRSILAGAAPTPTTKDISFAWWMVDRYASYQTLMNKGLDSSVAGHYILLRPTSEDSPLRFRIGGFQAYGGWGTECRVPAGAYQDGEWTHVVCTFDYASDTATIYINGELKPNGAYNPKTGIAGPSGYCQGVNDPTQPLYIVGQRETFQGDVDEVAIWDHALSPVDVAKVYVLGPLALDPKLAGRPQPADGAVDIRREATLGWSAGESAVSHDVYLGTVFEDVNNATTGSPLLVSQGQTDTTYDPPSRLEFGTTYYWRIDEVTAPPASTVKGLIWSFTTEPIAYPVAGNTIKATASSADADQGPENTINGKGLANDLHSDDLTAMWLTAPGSEGPAWIQYEFDKVLRLHEMWVWNHNGLLEPTLGLGAKEVVIEYSVDGVDFATLGAPATFSRAPGKVNYAANTAVDLGGIAAKYIRLTINRNWGGILPQSGLSEVRFFSVPVFAREPNPVPGRTNVNVATDLAWRAGREADKHNVYVSTDQQSVIDGTAPVVTVTGTSYTPALNLASTYYWRIDEVNQAETPSSWAGPVWRFDTEAYVVVDDFESYTDDMDAEKAIFQTWIDGYEVAANGSLVGYGTSPFAERTIINSGRQSMPLAYDNTGTATYSEAKRTFDNPWDWSRHNIKGLTLRFCGKVDNAVQQMYVKINNTKISYTGDPESLKRPSWQMCYIDLAGHNVSNVTSLSIGFDRIGATGGTGMVFIDDIRLYPLERQLITPADPGTAGLQAQYQLEGNANDSSGKGRNGSLKGAPMFVAGKAGQAISLNGTADYVNIDGYKGILADAAGVQQALTLSAWIKTATNGRDIIAWGTNAGGQRMNFRVDTVLRVEHGAGNILGSNGPRLIDNEWHHVAATVPQGGRIMDVLLYVDGMNVTPASTTTAVFNLQPNIDVVIGQGGTQGSRFFLGLIDETRIYDRVLSAGEIAWLAGRTTPFDKPF